MPSYIQNYGFTKTTFQDNNNEINNLIKWKGDYDGKIANIDLDVNDNGNRELVSMRLDNNDIRQLFGIQPVEVPLEKRLAEDFLYSSNPITLKESLIKRKSKKESKRKSKKIKSKKKRKTKTKKLY